MFSFAARSVLAAAVAAASSFPRGRESSILGSIRGITNMFTKKTIHDIDLQGKRVLLRADYNVPVSDDGKITDDYRLTQSLPTIKAILDKGASLVICSHLGRPEGPGDPKTTLKPVAARLSELLGFEV